LHHVSWCRCRGRGFDHHGLRRNCRFDGSDFGGDELNLDGFIRGLQLAHWCRFSCSCVLFRGGNNIGGFATRACWPARWFWRVCLLNLQRIFCGQVLASVNRTYGDHAIVTAQGTAAFQFS
jgi:hypothetical protein